MILRSLKCVSVTLQDCKFWVYLDFETLGWGRCMESLLNISSKNESVIEVDLGIWCHSVGLPLSVHLPCLWLLKNWEVEDYVIVLEGECFTKVFFKLRYQPQFHNVKACRVPVMICSAKKIAHMPCSQVSHRASPLPFLRLYVAWWAFPGHLSLHWHQFQMVEAWLHHWTGNTFKWNL